MFSVGWQWDFRATYPETLSTGTLQEFGPAENSEIGPMVKFLAEMLPSEKQA